MKPTATTVAFLAAFLATAACGSSERTETTQPESTTANGEDGGSQLGDAGGAPPAMEGCEHSLTDFIGDCYALEAPPVSQGYQLRYGPADYDDPDDVARFVLEPGEELVDCQHMTSQNEVDVLYDRYEMSARFGTHHMIVFGGGDLVAPDGTLGPCRGVATTGAQWLMAMQAGLDGTGARFSFPEEDAPVPPENEGLAWRMPARHHLTYQAHYINTTNEPILRESWTNIYLASEGGVREEMALIDFLGGMAKSVPAQGSAIWEQSSAACPLPQDEIRIVSFAGHMHAHGERFTAYKVGSSGERTKIYETFDWADADILWYDSVTDNGTPDPERAIGGGYSGILTLSAGEHIEWECEFQNDLDQPLPYANLAYEGEMCNFIGHYSPTNGQSYRCQSP